jgi:hypothetical protein
MNKEDIEAILTRDTEDVQKATQLILDLNNIRNKYTFESDIYKATFTGIGVRLEKMENYLRTLNKSTK